MAYPYRTLGIVIGAWLLAGLSILPIMAAVASAFSSFEVRYGELLAQYWRPVVRIHGIETTVFDYTQMAQDAEQPHSLFSRTREALEGTDPTRLENANASKAFWINAYNFGAMQLIVKHYPVDSIRSLKISLFKYPWSKDIVRIGDKTYSLNEIEKNILLQRFADPRIVFAVSCAAVSCPDRMPEPFTAARLDVQLDEKIRSFFRNPNKGLRIDRNAGILTLSWILDKDRALFAEQSGGILGFVLPYVGEETRHWLETHRVALQFFDHDWALNDVALADGAADER